MKIFIEAPFENYYFRNKISFTRVIREDKVWALFHASDPNRKENSREIILCVSFSLLG